MKYKFLKCNGAKFSLGDKDFYLQKQYENITIYENV